jgi:hypothetical protein
VVRIFGFPSLIKPRPWPLFHAYILPSDFYRLGLRYGNGIGLLNFEKNLLVASCVNCGCLTPS